ncbi:MAG: hypothetical protein ACLTLQ_03735 [[Clostridium] scindens]
MIRQKEPILSQPENTYVLHHLLIGDYYEIRHQVVKGDYQVEIVEEGEEGCP